MKADVRSARGSLDAQSAEFMWNGFLAIPAVIVAIYLVTIYVLARRDSRLAEYDR